MRNDDLFELPPPEPETDGAPALFVALFLLLLVFFILLNTISQPNVERARQVALSLQEAFKIKKVEDNKPSFFTPKVGVQANFKQFYDSMREAAGGVIKAEEGLPSRRGRTMLLSIPVSTVFTSGSANFLVNDLPLLRDVAKVFKHWENEGLDMEGVLYVDYTPPLPEAESEQSQLMLRRAARLRSALMDRGVNGEKLSLGLRPGNPDIITFQFFVRSNDKKWPTPLVPASKADESTAP